MDFAIVIIIGQRLKVFHRATFPDIPSIKKYPDIYQEVSGKQFLFIDVQQAQLGKSPFWTRAGLSYSDADGQDAWVEVEEMSEGGTEKVLDVMDLNHRPNIEKIFGWIAGLALEKGDMTDEDVASPPYPENYRPWMSDY